MSPLRKPDQSYEAGLQQIIAEYDRRMKDAKSRAESEARRTGRAVGGILRASKGNLQEWITERIVMTALEHGAGVSPSRIVINSQKIPIYVRPDYRPLEPAPGLSATLKCQRSRYYFNASVDRHVWIDGKFVCGIECKAYTENAMLKRILVDFRLLQTIHGEIVPMLFQLESMLGGDYHTCRWPCEGSESTHTLLSHFPDVQLRIVTLLEGERKVERPLHEFPKPLKLQALRSAAERFLKAVAPHV
jgi:hypothetical protein